MSFFISHIHADLRQARYARRGATHNAKDVPIGRHKEYQRMEKIMLPEPQHLDTRLADALNSRRSYYGGKNTGVIPIETWGTLLGLALKKREGTTSRQYPSGGSLYPIETYVISTAVPECAGSVFHYNPSLHALEKLWGVPKDISVSNLVHTKKTDLHFSTLIVLTGVWSRSSAKYGDFTYVLALLEAGHMSENILLVATALGLQNRPMAGFNDESISKILDLDLEEEQPILAIMLSMKEQITINYRM